MKKRILASLMSLCLLVGLLPTAAFAAEGTFPTEQAEQLAICTCEVLCTEDGKDETCTVCVKDYTLCEAQAEPTTTEQENGMDTQPGGEDVSDPAGPVCAELAGCVDGSHAPECPLYVAPVVPDEETEEVPAPVEPAEENVILDPAPVLENGMFGNCGESGSESSVTWGLEQNNEDTDNPTYTLTISGTGAIKDYAHHSDSNHTVTEDTCTTQDCDYNRPWASHIESITSIVIENGVTGIGNCAFRSMSAVTSASIGNSVTVIGENAFKDCESLTSIKIPDSVTELKGYCFYSCGSLNTIEIGTGLTTLDQYKTCFGGTSSLKSFEVAEGNTSYSSHNGVLMDKEQTEIVKVPSAISGVYDIPEGVTYVTGFTDCTQLTEITIPSTAIAISESCFKGCTALEKVNFTPTTTLKYIGNKVDGSTAQGGSAFSGCTSLTEIVIPDSVEKLYLNTFANCTSLKTATLGTGINELRNNIFIGCSSLETIYYNATNVTATGSNVNQGFTGSSSSSTATNSVKLVVGANVTSIPATLYSNQQTTETLISEIDISAATQLSNFVLNNRDSKDGDSKDVVLICGPSFEKDTITIPTGYTYNAGENDILSKVETNDTSATVQSGIGIAVLNKKDCATIVVIKNGSVSMQFGGETSVNTSSGDTATISDWSSADDTVIVDSSGKITAKKVGEASVTANISVGNDISSTLTVKVNVTPRVLTYSLTGGDVGSGSISYNFTEGHKALSDVMTFKWTDDPNKTVTLTEGTDIDYTYTVSDTEGQGGGDALTYDYLPMPVGEYKNVKFNLLNENYTFALTDEEGSTRDYLEITVNVVDTSKQRAYLASAAPKADQTFTYDGTGKLPVEGVLQAYAQNSTASQVVEIGTFTVNIEGLNNTTFSSEVENIQAGTNLADISGLELPTKPGTYIITASASNESYYLYKSLVFSIGKATVTVKADDKSVYVGNGMPEFTYTVTGLVGDNVLTKEPTLTCDASNTNTVGTYTITASGAEADAELYNLVHENGTLTVSRRSSGGGGGGSSSSSHSVSVDSDKNGTVSVNKDNASQGSTVTITVKPDSGYELGDLIVTDKNGNEIKLTDKGNGKYTFKMPGSKVEIEASFVPQADPDIGLPFNDVASGSWYEDAVWYVYENGLMSGTSGTTFEPDTTTSRGMIVTVLYRLEGAPTVSGASAFTDVADGQYYADAVAWAAANNIVGGYGNGLFGPNDTITREQMAAILYRYAQYKGYDVTASTDLSDYSDVAQVSSYALAALQWANAEGLVNGTSDTTLTPGGSATRAQVAVILMRFCENIAEK